MSANKLSAGALKRLMVEYKQLSQSAAKDSEADTMFIAGPATEDNFFAWEALIKGPSDTPFENGVFAAHLTFPKDYPLNPPKVSYSALLDTRLMTSARCASTRPSSIPTYTPTAKSAFPSSTPPATIPCTTSRHPSAGPPSRA
jgi:hypothetical protein